MTDFSIYLVYKEETEKAPKEAASPIDRVETACIVI